MEMTPEQSKISQEAFEYAKQNRTRIAHQLCDPDTYPREVNPVSVFMAGSPGAGKTEASKALIAEFSSKILRLDPDELRENIPGYTGANAWLYQSAAIKILERVHDLALDQQQSFILDGTLSSYTKSLNNISRSLKKHRPVQILYVYQEPNQAWRFVQAREAVEGRRIESDVFIQAYFGARNVVNRLKKELGKDIRVDLLVKNIDGSNGFAKSGVDVIDNHIPEKYSESDVRRILGASQTLTNPPNTL